MNFFLEVLYDQNDTKAQAFFRILAMTEMKKQEAGALEWKDVSFKDTTITINKAVTRTEKVLEIDNTKTAESNRIRSIDNVTLEKLAEWKDEVNPLTNEWLIFGNANAKNKHDLMSLDASRK